MAYIGNSPANRLYSTRQIELAQGQTVVNVNYTPGMVLFFKNGALLDAGIDYTATNGSTVTLASPANAGDILVGVNLAQFAVANAIPYSKIGAGPDEIPTNLTLQPEHTASATLTGSDNQIVMTGIVPALGLEVGDVIQFIGGGDNNGRLHTVEVITDDNTIVVNYEHCGSRGDGSLKLFNYSGSLTVKRIAKWFNAPVGLGQDWVDVIALKADLDVQYMNPYGGRRAVMVGVARQDGLGNDGIDADGISWPIANGMQDSGITSVIVPYKNYFRHTPAGSGEIRHMGELR